MPSAGCEVARSASERGELVLRRRADDALELRVNGVFVMDTTHTTSERMLARTALECISAAPDLQLTVLIGGLGLGFTLQEVLADDRVGRVIVAEIEPDLVEWHRRRLVPHTQTAVADSRVEVRVGDIRAISADLPAGSCHLVLLDVDNGPGFLVYDANEAIYHRDFLDECHRLNSAGGATAVWAADPAPTLETAITDVFGACTETALPVTLGRRETTYHILFGRKR